MQPTGGSKSSPLAFFVKAFFFIFVPILIIGGLVYGIPRYYYPLTDWYKLQNYTPSPEIKKLADQAHMSDEGRRIFYVHDPQIDQKTAFNSNCPFAERTFVLGCYTGSSIYILSVTEPRLKSVEAVTAAHEMLHAAYSRLSADEKTKVDALLQKDFKAKADDRLEALIEDYRKQDPSSVPTELHSIMGTEVSSLSPELEAHYKRYFTDRSKVVAAYNGYEQVFTNLENRIKAYETEIENLRAEIERLDGEIKATRTDINDINKELSQHRAQDDIDGYNALVPKQNALVNSYNADVRAYNAAIRSHNAKVKAVNAIVLRQNQLVNSIDSKYQEL